MSEGCLLEGSGSSSEVQMGTEGEEAGERGAQSLGEGAAAQNALSVGGVGCWHLAAQMLQVTQQSSRLFSRVGLSALPSP